MKHIFTPYIWIIVLILAIYKPANSQDIPFSTNETNLTIWNGTDYVPFFINGTNLGVSIPGTFPGHLAASRKQYGDWFKGIKNVGFNCIRIYTLHYPRFYEVLDSFNLANPQNPLLFIQGVWLEEELPDDEDLIFLTDPFRVEAEENIDCLHGNREISSRFGKAFGNYTVDASKWCLAYIIGREIMPSEVLKTNINHPESVSFSGQHFSIKNASATEVWLTSQLDNLVDYENKNYNTQRPVSASSWPTLDPLSHPEEIHRDEDTVSINLSGIKLLDAPAGLFMSYHAYPYYPDFISHQSDYLSYSDSYGSNSYKGYLNDLKAHYPNFPLIIAEYGVPSSWGVAHYATSGMNHGGFDEAGQGNTDIRLLNTIEATNCGGGIQFAWIDEWFKRTWVTDHIDYNPEDRILWHNVTAAEQNFGLLTFKKPSNLQSIKQFNTDSEITELKADANYDFFEMEVGLDNTLDVPDELWIALDTYADDLGESILPGGETIPFRSEFSLKITNYSATLYVTQAYDIYGIYFGDVSDEKQLYHSTASDGAPWRIVRWKNNSGDTDIQYIGNLQVNYDFQNPSSKDAVTISADKIHIKLPWSLLNVVAPNRLAVLHSYPDSLKQDTITDGFNIGLFYHNQWFKTDQRFSWTGWDRINKSTVVETPKLSYTTMKNQLTQYNVSAIAMRDTFIFDTQTFPVTIDSIDGILKNDFDLDGEIMVSLVAEDPRNGNIDLHNDGSFSYYPNDNFDGIDSMKYFVYDGYTLSEPNVVLFDVTGNSIKIGDVSQTNDDFMVVSPNPSSSSITIKTDIIFEQLHLFNSIGQEIHTFQYGKDTYEMDISNLATGVYMLVGQFDHRYYSKKIVKK